MAVAGYVIRGGLAGRERLRVLARVQSVPTIRLLTRVGIERGARCLDAGCGGGDVSLDLARIAGPEGEVVGIDRDKIKLDLAREEARAAGLGNVSYRVADVTQLEADGEFDVVYSRFLLAHLADPAAVMERLVAAARPGGLVVMEDIDFRGAFCHPENRAYRRPSGRTAATRRSGPNCRASWPGRACATSTSASCRPRAATPTSS